MADADAELQSAAASIPLAAAAASASSAAVAAAAGQGRSAAPRSSLENVKVLVKKNFLLKHRSYRRLSCGCFPCLFFFEFIMPPLLLLLLTWLKQEAPVFVVTTGWGTDNLKCNDERTCTMSTPVDCKAGEVASVDLNQQAKLSGVSNGLVRTSARPLSRPPGHSRDKATRTLRTTHNQG